MDLLLLNIIYGERPGGAVTRKIIYTHATSAAPVTPTMPFCVVCQPTNLHVHKHIPVHLEVNLTDQIPVIKINLV